MTKYSLPVLTMETIEALRIVNERLNRQKEHTQLIDKLYNAVSGPDDPMNKYIIDHKEDTEALSIVLDLAYKEQNRF